MPMGPLAGRRAVSEREDPVFVGLGSNLGDREGFLRMALRELDSLAGVRVVAASRVWESAPVGPSSRTYLNAVVGLACRLAAPDLLAAMQRIEGGAGRRRGGPRWGARSLDLDLLLVGDARIQEPGLRVPHPRLHQRDFVLVPLCELAGERRHPVLGRRLDEIRAERPPPAGLWLHPLALRSRAS